MTDHLNRKMFFDDTGGDLPRFETVKYPYIDDLSERMISLFWRPQEIVLGTRDRVDFENASEGIQHAFTANLKRQIMLDGRQQVAPSSLFLPLASLPEVEDALIKWGFFESIHSRSYTHIIRAVYPSNPSAIFDTVRDIPEIRKADDSINRYYRELQYQNARRKMFEEQDIHVKYDEYEHKKAFWRAMFASFALEGIRFMASFACNFGIAENKILEGPAKVLKLIARDEMEHLKLTREFLVNAPKEDDDFLMISIELHDEMYALFKAVVDEEKGWAPYMFAKGTFLGLNEEIMCDALDWFAHLRLTSLGMKWKEGHPKKDPIPWMQNWLLAGKKQSALQETENDEYLIGITDLNDDDLSDLTVQLT